VKPYLAKWPGPERGIQPAPVGACGDSAAAQSVSMAFPETTFVLGLRSSALRFLQPVGCVLVIFSPVVVQQVMKVTLSYWHRIYIPTRSGTRHIT